MKINTAQLWINATNMGGMEKFSNHSFNPNCKLEQREVDRLPRMCFFAIKKIKENSDCYVECDDDCTSGEQCTKKRIKNKTWKSAEKKMTENGKEYGLFVKED